MGLCLLCVCYRCGFSWFLKVLQGHSAQLFKEELSVVYALNGNYGTLWACMTLGLLGL